MNIDHWLNSKSSSDNGSRDSETRFWSLRGFVGVPLIHMQEDSVDSEEDILLARQHYHFVYNGPSSSL